MHDPRTLSPLYRHLVRLINAAAANPGNKYGVLLPGGTHISVIIDTAGRRTFTLYRPVALPRVSEASTFMRYWPEAAPARPTWVAEHLSGGGHTITATWPKPGTSESQAAEVSQAEQQTTLF